MNQRSADVVVVGGGYAGTTAANRFPRGTRVILVDPKEHFVHRVRLHEWVAGRRPNVRIPFRDLLAPGVEHVQRSVSHVEPGLVRCSDGSEYRARHILLTSGSDRAVPDGIGDCASAERARQRLERCEAGSDVIVRGAGLTGIELAAEVAEARPDLTVHLVGRTPVGTGMHKAERKTILRGLEKLGVQLDSAPPVPALEFAVTGFQVSQLAHDSGLPVAADGRLRVTETLECVPGIWGAGDAVQVADQSHLRASCATAIPMGAHAADNIARALRGEPAPPFEFGYSFRCVSLGRKRGAIVRVDRADRPTGNVISGRPAAWFKAAICAYVLRAVAPTARRRRAAVK